MQSDHLSGIFHAALTMMRKYTPHTPSSFLIMLILVGCGWHYSDKSHGDDAALQSGLNGSSTLTISNHEFTAYHPESFKLEYLNDKLTAPRIIHFHRDRMFIGSKSGVIYRLDPPYDKAHAIARLGKYPHSVIIRNNQIYVAQTDGIYRADYDGTEKWIAEADFDLYVPLPGGGGHNSRTLKMGPSGGLYVGLGIRGNCSDEYLDDAYPFENRRGGIFAVDESSDPPFLRPFASGLRNPVGFDWHPQTEMMYASNNGPDHLGYDLPPEYFSRITENSFHGMPWYQFNGQTLRRDSCIASAPPRPENEVVTPAVTFPARIAPMDVAFVPRHAGAETLIGHALVALHGSWATAEDGSARGDLATRRPPKIVLVEFENQQPIRVKDFVTGFQSKYSGSRWLRPVGIAIGPDGHIYFTSDAGMQGLYRLRKLY